MRILTFLSSFVHYCKHHIFGTIITVAILWLCFISEHSLWAIWKLQREKERLQNEIVSYRNTINQFEQSINEVSGDREAMEHFAREKLNMKRPNEDVYLFDE